MKLLVSEANCTLSLDGWSTLSNEPVLGVCFYANGSCYLVSKRTSMVLTPVVYAAYLLDPHHTGEKMNPSEVSEAVSYIKDSCESDVLPALMKYMGKIAPYSPHSFGSSFKNVSSDSWWKGGLRMGFDPILVDVACSIVEAVSSSAGLERYFSTMGLTYGRLRSSLGVEKAGKLSFLFRQLNR